MPFLALKLIWVAKLSVRILRTTINKDFSVHNTNLDFLNLFVVIRLKAVTEVHKLYLNEFEIYEDNIFA